MAEVKAIWGSFKNVTELNFAAFLRRFLISENRRSWESGTWESLAWCSAPAQDKCLCLRCCIPKPSFRLLFQLGAQNVGMLAWPEQALLSSALFHLCYKFSVVKILKVRLRNFCKYEYTWQGSSWADAAIPVCAQSPLCGHSWAKLGEDLEERSLLPSPPVTAARGWWRKAGRKYLHVVRWQLETFTSAALPGMRSQMIFQTKLKGFLLETWAQRAQHVARWVTEGKTPVQVLWAAGQELLCFPAMGVRGQNVPLRGEWQELSSCSHKHSKFPVLRKRLPGVWGTAQNILRLL